MTDKRDSHSRRNLLKIASVAGGVLIAVAVAVILLVQANVDLLIKWQIDRNISASLAAQEVPNSRFEVIFCGTGTPRFSPDRGQPCLGVIAGGRLLMFDAGQAAAGHLNAAAAPLERLEAIFLTHLHSDHISGLGETLHNGWLYGREKPVEVVGPPGTARLLKGFQEVYAADIKVRRGIVEAEYLDTYSGIANVQEVQIDTDEAVTVYDRDGVVVRAFRVDHPTWTYAYGYRIEFRGKAVVVSGDTRYTPAIALHARGVDMLIHEALNVEMMSIAGEVIAEKSTGIIDPDRMKSITSRHTPTHEVAQAAAEADVKMLVITHLTPAIPAIGLLESVFTRGMDETFDGEILVARDGMRLTLLD